MAALAHSGFDLSSVPVVDNTDDDEFYPAFQGSSYDFGGMPSLEMNLAAALDDDSDGDCASIGFFQSLVKGFGG